MPHRDDSIPACRNRGGHLICGYCGMSIPKGIEHECDFHARLLFDANQTAFRERRVVFVGVERSAAEYAAARRLSRYGFYMPMGRPRVMSMVRNPTTIHVVWAHGFEKLEKSSADHLRDIIAKGATEEFYDP